MGSDGAQGGGRKAPRPLDAARLEEMALAYVARFATSAGKLEAYLTRKLRERGWAGDPEDGDGGYIGAGRADIAAVIARFVELGYVDDAGFARMRSGSLLRRGYGSRRIAQDLSAAGIEDSIRQDCAPDEAEARRAVLAMARRKGFGPFTREMTSDQSLDPGLRERQMASLLRAGHGMAQARALLALRDPLDAERWVAEAEEDAPDEPGDGRGFRE
ncbi:MAG: RecX family transcriptional regulator [Sphingomonadales bacterium]|nr:RecX family transcriptional regulator [Sphingomonadales bacterium]MDE2168021.1 RecX family transcriptional regulator [Sphingomonadales bacterium]